MPKITNKFFNAFSITVLLACLSVFLIAQPQPIGPYGTTSWNAFQTLSATTATLSARNMVGPTKSTATAAATLTSPTATVLCTLFPFVGSSNADSFNWDWYLVNDSAGANTVTVAGGTGVTVLGTATVAQNAVKHFRVNLTGCGGTPAARVYSLGSATY